MNKIPGILISIGILLAIAGCRQALNSTGAGFGSKVSGSKALMYSYGYDGENKLAYAIFSDLDSNGTIGSVSGSWGGSFKPATGSSITYKADAKGLEFNGTNYDFAAGRVFLVSTSGSTTSVTQLSVPFTATDYKAEIALLEKQADVKKFLESAGAP